MAAGAMRVEKDSLGELEVPAEAYWGVQTQRAILNFPISGTPLPRAFIHAHVMLKKAAAEVNRELGLLEGRLADAIVRACEEVLADAQWSRDQFPVDVYQTGSGTSTNMNVNEVLASRANEILGGQRGDKKPVHPNDHVNMGQSSNDSIPTSMQVMALLEIDGQLDPALGGLVDSLYAKAKELWPIIKTGRTHLQDATPIRLGQEFAGYNGQLGGILTSGLMEAARALRYLPIGGTAVGTGINSHPRFASRVCALLSEWTKTRPPFKESKNHFADQATLDAVVAAHGILKNLAVALTKICNDIRWMGSGPRAGLGEIELPAVQPGSSIMPGKVNPVICESVLMVCQRVIGNDAAMTAAGCGNNFELAMSIPLAALLLHESITLLANACRNLATQCIDGLRATGRGPALVEQGLMLATALAPAIGYDAAAAIAKEAAKTGRTIREVAREKTTLSDAQLADLLDPEKMVGDSRPDKDP
ncbi:MAG TPA: class II fumarate hydratase [Phycisphaerae bacterium]|jgi:fumarate hydratase class II|nr:class II fumarate hydratase [Phycisphaerae bacterium]